MKAFCMPTNGFECTDGYLDLLGVILDIPFTPWIGMEIHLNAPKEWGCNRFTFHVRDIVVLQDCPIVQIWGSPSPIARNEAYVVDRSKADAEKQLRAIGWMTEDEAFGDDA